MTDLVAHLVGMHFNDDTTTHHSVLEAYSSSIICPKLTSQSGKILLFHKATFLCLDGTPFTWITTGDILLLPVKTSSSRAYYTITNVRLSHMNKEDIYRVVLQQIDGLKFQQF